MSGGSVDDPVDAILAAWREAAESSGLTSPEDVVRAHPAHADALRRRFAVLALVDEALREGVADVPPPESVGDYKILRELGRGGMGAVYEAEQVAMGRRVALKILRAGFGSRPAAVERFLREARAAGRLHHTHLVPVHDLGREGPLWFYAMELVDGESLAVLLARGRETAFATSPAGVGSTAFYDAVASAFVGVAEALAAAHDAGVVHRDVKPGNLLFDRRRGHLRLTDFGLAAALDDAAHLTKSGDVVGTPNYLSPEQAAGKPVDGRTDVYSLGATIYETLSGEPPVKAQSTAEAVAVILSRDPVPPRRKDPRIPRDLESIVQKAMERDPARRYASARDFAADLRAFVERRPLRARRIGPLSRALRFARRRPAAAALIAVVALTLPSIAALVTARIGDRAAVEATRRRALEDEKDELLAEASYALSELDGSRAIDLYRRVLALDDASQEAACGLALTHLAAKRPDEALRTLDAYAAVLGSTNAAGRVRERSLRALAGAAGGRPAESRPSAPESALDHYVFASMALDNCDDVDRAAAGVALNHATSAVLSASRPRLHFYVHRLHAAGHAGDQGAVRATAEAIARHWPASVMARRMVADALLNLGDPTCAAEAETIYRSLTEIRPQDVLLREALFGCLLKQDKAEEALRVASAPGLPPAAVRELRARALTALSRYEEAIPEYRALPDEPHPRRRARRLGSLGFALVSVGRLAEAETTLREAVRLHPSSAAYHVDLGWCLSKADRVDEAVKEFERALALPQPDLRAHAQLAATLSKAGRNVEAIDRYRHGIEEDRLGRHPEIRHNLGVLLRQAERWDEAIEAYRSALAIDPDYVDAWRNLALAYEHVGRVDDAIHAFREEIRSARGAARSWEAFARALDRFGRPEDALAAFAAARAADPSYAQAATNLCALLCRMQRYADAVVAGREAVRLAPRDPVAHFNLGLALFARGYGSAAVKAFRDCLAAAADVPDFEQGDALARLPDAERLAGWEQEFDRRAADGSTPEDPAEIAQLADIANRRGRHQLAVDWFTEAFRRQKPRPGNVSGRGRTGAARAALLRASESRPSTDAPPDDPVGRRLALEWMREELAELEKAYEDWRVDERTVKRLLEEWRIEPDFEPVRGDAGLARLPPSEQSSWRALWEEVRRLESLVR